MTTAFDRDAVLARQAAYRDTHAHEGAFACCTAHASADDVPALLAEIDHLNGYLDAVLVERDDNAEMADKLAEAIGALTGTDMGEHSNRNDPWANALTHAEQLASSIKTQSALVGAAVQSASRREKKLSQLRAGIVGLASNYEYEMHEHRAGGDLSVGDAYARAANELRDLLTAGGAE